MKVALVVNVFLYILFHKPVYGAKVKQVLEIDPKIYGPDGNYLRHGQSKKIVCRVEGRTQKIDWYDPSGNLVHRRPNKHVYVQDTFMPSLRTPARGSLLYFSEAKVDDSGTWECRSGDLREDISVCVLDPTEFTKNTTTEITVDRGRSITLGCQVRGGAPEPIILWRKDGEEIVDSESTKYEEMTIYKMQGLEGLLTITDVVPEDRGTYTCIAIQRNKVVDDCVIDQSLNVTLNVNYAPYFEVDNTTVRYYYAKNNHSVDLVCAAEGFPIPTYRWFHDQDEIFTEFSEKQITFSESGEEATLTLIANSSTFGEKYQCRATNPYGHSFSNHLIVKLEKPPKPREISISNFTHDQVEFNVTWADELVPVESFDVQYFEKKTAGIPREYHWKKVKVTQVEISSVNTNPEKLVTLADLEEETEYWVRLRARNEAGISPWSAPILAGTDTAPLFTDSSSVKLKRDRSPYYYGVGGTAAIVIFASACILGIKKLQ